MKITPVDIAHHSFSKKMFGLDEAEVMDYLQQIATQMESLIIERNAMRESLKEKEISISELKEKDGVLRNTINAASQMAEKLRADADRETKLIIADAHQKADMISRDARDSLKKIYQEISDLKRVRMQFEANLKALAQAHLSLIEQGEKYMPQIGLPNMEIQNEQKRSPEISPLSASNSARIP